MRGGHPGGMHRPPHPHGGMHGGMPGGMGGHHHCPPPHPPRMPRNFMNWGGMRPMGGYRPGGCGCCSCAAPAMVMIVGAIVGIIAMIF